MDRHYDNCPSCLKPKKKVSRLCSACAPPPNKGRKLSDEWKQKLSESHKGKKGYWLGKKRPSEEKSWVWKGDKVGYRGLHLWVSKHLGKPRTCVQCGISTLGARQYHWANISGQYKRDLNDWQRMCVKCHIQYDKITKQ